MDRRAIPLGRIWGVSIRLDYTWFLVFALLTWALATAYLPYEIALPAAAYWVMGASAAVLFFASVLLHELGHSIVAMRFRIPVHRITLFLFGGIAEIGMEPPSPVAEFLVAIAGPIVSFALAVAFAALAVGAGRVAPVFVLAQYLALINGSLAVFNLIPGFPLDGGRILHAAVWWLTGNQNRATGIAATLGRVTGFIFIGFGLWQAVHGDLGGLWIALLGWFLQGLAAQQSQQQKVHQKDLADMLTGHGLGQVSGRGFVRVPAEMTLQELVEMELPNVAARAFLVERNGVVIGLLTWRDVNAVPRSNWRQTPLAEAMTPIIQEQGASLEARPGTPLAVPIPMAAGREHPA